MKKSFLFLLLLTLFFGALFWLRKFYQSFPPSLPNPVIIGTSADYPPFVFKKNGSIIGFDIDIITEACKRLGNKIAIKEMPFELLMPQIQLGTIHVIAAGISATEQRKKKAFFTPSYLNNDTFALLSLKKQPITTLENLARKDVAVNQGYTADNYISKLQDIAVHRFPSITESILALRAEKVAAFITASNTIEPIFKEYGQGSFNLTVIEDTNENTALAISLMYPELAKKLSAIIITMQKDGTISSFKEKWKIQ